jgi:DNA-directed RNA polymerase
MHLDTERHIRTQTDTERQTYTADRGTKCEMKGTNAVKAERTHTYKDTSSHAHRQTHRNRHRRSQTRKTHAHTHTHTWPQTQRVKVTGRARNAPAG